MIKFFKLFTCYLHTSYLLDVTGSWFRLSQPHWTRRCFRTDEQTLQINELRLWHGWTCWNYTRGIRPFHGWEKAARWWKPTYVVENKRTSFSEIGKSGKECFCVPASSVPCERLFSSAGIYYIVNKRRAELDPHTVNVLVCLRDWCH